MPPIPVTPTKNLQVISEGDILSQLTTIAGDSGCTGTCQQEVANLKAMFVTGGDWLELPDWPPANGMPSTAPDTTTRTPADSKIRTRLACG